MPSKFTDAQHDQALTLVREGVGYREITRRTGVARSTISTWARAAGIDTEKADQVAAAAEANRVGWHKRRGELIDRFGDLAELMLERTEACNESADAKNLITAAAIAVDKAQLLSGGATSRYEQVGLDKQRERVRAMQDELAERRAAKDGTAGG